jgi:acyl-CoA hydrolase
VLTPRPMPRTIATDDLHLADFIKPGDGVVWGQITAEPATLVESLSDQYAQLSGIRAFVGMSVFPTLSVEAAEHIAVTAAGGAGTNHRFARNGHLNTLPIHISRIPHHIRRGDIPCDVALIHAAAGGDATLNLALSADYMGVAVDQARVVIAEVNNRLPRTFGDTAVPLDKATAIVPTSRAPATFIAPPPGPTEQAIGRYVAELVPDGATVQMGVGAVPDAVMAALAGKRDLGIHTGIVTDRALDLIEAGSVTNRKKELDDGITVAAVLYGTERLYRWAHDNERLRVRSVAYTHAPHVLAQFERFFAINSAIEVDLTGQVNGEVAGSRPVGLIGGQVDFARAGLWSKGGRNIVALRSTARKGTLSTIVPRLESGIVTTPRADADVVATEYGIAELAGVGVEERAKRLIAIAHPDFRAELTKALDRLC